MSRRASFFARQHPGIRRVRFPDEIVFEESIKEADGEAIMGMLRRVSLCIDVNRINMAGMTALHQAVLDDSLVLVRLLLLHGAHIDKTDTDSWTPLHAASANGHYNIVRYLLSQGADPDKETEDGETAADLVDEEDRRTLAVLEGTEDQYLESVRKGKEEGEEEEEDEKEKEDEKKDEKKEEDKVRRLSVGLREPAWVRKLSHQEDERDTRRKGSAWVGREDIVEEEDEEEGGLEEGKEMEEDMEEGGEAGVKIVGKIQKEEIPNKEQKHGKRDVCDEKEGKMGIPHVQRKPPQGRGAESKCESGCEEVGRKSSSDCDMEQGGDGKDESDNPEEEPIEKMAEKSVSWRQRRRGMAELPCEVKLLLRDKLR